MEIPTPSMSILLMCNYLSYKDREYWDTVEVYTLSSDAVTVRNDGTLCIARYIVL